MNKFKENFNDEENLGKEEDFEEPRDYLGEMISERHSLVNKLIRVFEDYQNNPSLNAEDLELLDYKEILSKIVKVNQNIQSFIDLRTEICRDFDQLNEKEETNFFQ